MNEFLGGVLVGFGAAFGLVLADIFRLLLSRPKQMEVSIDVEGLAEHLIGYMEERAVQDLPDRDRGRTQWDLPATPSNLPATPSNLPATPSNLPPEGKAGNSRPKDYPL